MNHSGSNVSSFERRGRMAVSGLWALVCGAQGSRKAEDTFGLAWRKASFGLTLEEPEKGHGRFFVFFFGLGGRGYSTLGGRVPNAHRQGTGASVSGRILNALALWAVEVVCSLCYGQVRLVKDYKAGSCQGV